MWEGDAPPDPDPEILPLEVYARDDFNRITESSWGFGNIGGVYTMLWGFNAQNAFLTVVLSATSPILRGFTNTFPSTKEFIDNLLSGLGPPP